MNHIKILDQKECTGCGLCANICPKGAIVLQKNGEGFLFPSVGDQCVACGLCTQRCPQLKPAEFHDGLECFAVNAKDKFRERCSSGGIFAVISESILEQGGVVYGAGFDDSFRNLSHMPVRSKRELPRILKSKYLQSDMEKIYPDVERNLREGRQVAFCGCPCQVAALKNFLGRSYENLLTLDLLCHGVPSPLAYQKFLEEVSGGRVVTGVDFRDKQPGWGTLISVVFSDGTIHYDRHDGNYFRAFLSGLSMRECCNDCRYAQPKRVGDLTIGDFWGIHRFDSEIDDRKGTSFVQCNTVRGVRAVERCKRDYLLFRSVPIQPALDICRRFNGALSSPVPANSMRKCFFRHLETDSFSRALKYAEKGLIDVGLVGWWMETPRSNYGSTLTDFALYQYLLSLGLSAAFISPPGFDRELAGDFNKRYGYRMTMKYSEEDMRENNRYIDAFIVASDVLWYYDAFKQTGYLFLLDFVDGSKRKISYATSFGNTKQFFPPEELPKASYYLNRFDYVSVRESEAVEICREQFGVEAVQVLDPVFLCGDSVWKTLAGNAQRKTKGRYVFAYLLDPDERYAEELKALARRLDCETVTIVDRQVNAQSKAELMSECGVLPNASIEEYIYHLMNAEFVVTDSFHGFCFSLIFKKHFFAVVNRARGASRFDTLSKRLETESRMLESIGEIGRMEELRLFDTDFERLEENIVREIRRSKDWLCHALFSPRTKGRAQPLDWIWSELQIYRHMTEELTERVEVLEKSLNHE